jgi:hypothetical protein
MDNLHGRLSKQFFLPKPTFTPPNLVHETAQGALLAHREARRSYSNTFEELRDLAGPSNIDTAPRTP